MNFVKMLLPTIKPVFHECDWVVMTSVLAANQSDCFFLRSRENWKTDFTHLKKICKSDMRNTGINDFRQEIQHRSKSTTLKRSYNIPITQPHSSCRTVAIGCLQWRGFVSTL
jgi:hypothetical protein